MCSLARVRQLQDLHEERDELKVAKITKLFIDGELDTPDHLKCLLSNIIHFLFWVYKDPQNTYLYRCITKGYNLLKSEGAKRWLAYACDSQPHLVFGLAMEFQVIFQSTYQAMVTNGKWISFLEDG